MKEREIISNSINELYLWLALLRVPTVGPKKFNDILQTFPNLKEFFQAPHDVLQSMGFSQDTIINLRNPDWKGVEQDLAWSEKDKNHILPITHANYPFLLKQISNPPPLLFVQGNIELLSHSQIAMVGSRNPTPIGTETALNFAKQLVEKGLTITSGLALGIDAAGHRGALEGNGPTIAVTGTGLDHIYPKRHTSLAENIATHGALISEFPIGTPAVAENFPRRNRIISGLSLGTLVIEATLRSGSLITARFANEQGREVFAIPGSIHNPLSRGCHALIKQGAKLVEEVGDILEELKNGLPSISFRENSTQNQSLPLHEQLFSRLDDYLSKLLNCIGFEPTPIDILVERTGKPMSELASLLIQLELQGMITTTARGYLRVKL